MDRINSEKLCTCPDAQLYHSTSLLCGRCGGRFTPFDIAEEVQETVQKVTEGEPDRLSAGNILIAAKKAEPELPSSSHITKRDLLMMFGTASITKFFDLIAEPVRTLIATRSGALWTGQKDQEEANFRARSGILTEDDIRNAENALLRDGVDSLRIRAKQYEHEQKYSMSMLFNALTDHAIGIQSRSAERDLTALLKDSPDPAVRSRLLFHRGRARVFCGHTEEGLSVTINLIYNGIVDKKLWL